MIVQFRNLWEKCHIWQLLLFTLRLAEQISCLGSYSEVRQKYHSFSPSGFPLHLVLLCELGDKIGAVAALPSSPTHLPGSTMQQHMLCHSPQGTKQPRGTRREALERASDKMLFTKPIQKKKPQQTRPRQIKQL